MLLRNEIILKRILQRVAKARRQAGLVGKPFELGIVTDTKPSLVFDVIFESMHYLEKRGMAKWAWHDDAYRAKMRLAGEELFISISGLR